MDTAPVLLIAHTFPPSGASGGARAFRFYKYLPRNGYRPLVVCAEPHLAEPRYPDVYRVPAAGAPDRLHRQSHRALRAQRYLLPMNDDLDWVPYAVEEGKRLILAHGVWSVISTSPPVATHYAAGWLQRKFGLHWVADFRDPLVDNPFRSRLWPFPYNRWAEQWILGHADRAVANTEDVAAAWKARYPQLASRFSVIWNGYDPEERPQPVPPACRERRVLAHVGLIYGGRKPAALAASLERLLDRGKLNPSSFVVELIGEADLAPDPEYDSRMERLRARGCIAGDGRRVPRAEANRRMAEADWLLLLDLNESDKSVQVPAKLFDYLCVNRPILAFTNRGSPTARILRDSGVGQTCVYRDSSPEETDTAILDFLTAPVRETEPNSWFRSTFDGAEQTRALAALLRPQLDPALAGSVR